MPRRVCSVRGLILITAAIVSQTSDAADRPNIVWILCEDTGAEHLRHFDPAGAQTPHIESMAAAGVTFDRAFSGAPVCSVARTALLTGCHPPRIAAAFHRPVARPTLPDSVSLLPAVMRAAGYHATNRAKEDYNVVTPPDLWDDSSRTATWRDRPSPDTPFFHVRTLHGTHEGQLHFDASEVQSAPTRTDPDSVNVPDYLPDTELVRYTIARQLDHVAQMDRRVGEILEQLDDDGVLERTVVFFFGDHGGPLPRSKGYVYESGLRVPMVVRLPAELPNLTDRQTGDRTGGFVHFVDLAATTASLAGTSMRGGDGEAFLGPDVVGRRVDSRQVAIGYADRMDAKLDLNRSIRVGDLKYIRHFEPFYPDSLDNLYRYKMAAYRQWRNQFESGELDWPVDAFFRPRSPEALYDLAVDPGETDNLADDPERRGDLLRMRTKLMDALRSWPDLSLMTEAFLVDTAGGPGAMSDPVRYGDEVSDRVTRYLDTVNLGLQPMDQAAPLIVQALDDTDPLVRYWAVVAATSMGDPAAELLPEVQKRMLDVEPMIVARAVEFAWIHRDFTTPTPGMPQRFSDVRPYFYRSLNRTLSEAESLPIIRTGLFLTRRDPGQFRLDVKRLGLDMLRPGPNDSSQRYWDHLVKLQTELDP